MPAWEKQVKPDSGGQAPPPSPGRGFVWATFALTVFAVSVFSDSPLSLRVLALLAAGILVAALPALRPVPPANGIPKGI